MRFQQMKNNPDTIMRKKMYKKGKNWIVASTLALGGVAMFSTPVVNAATADQGQAPTEQVEGNQGDKTPETPDKDTQISDKGNDKKYVNTTVTVKSNMGDQVYKVSGYCNSDVQIIIHAIGMAVADKNVITVHIDDKGVATTKEELVYTIKDKTPEKETPDFELPNGLGTNEVAHFGKVGTSNFVITNNGALYILAGDLTVKDTQELGKKFGKEIKTIEMVEEVNAPEDSSSLFAKNFENVTSMNLSQLNTSNVTNMNSMFANMTSLKNIDFASMGLNTGKVTNMHAMFSNDENLESVDVSHMSTENVTDFSDMFSNASSLRSLNVSSFNMKAATSTSHMFSGTNLTQITLGAKNKFAKTDTLPSANSQTWKSVGNGTVEKPQGDLTFAPNDVKGNSLIKYYDGSGKTGRQTFVVKAVANVHTLVIKSNLGDQTVHNVKGNPGDTVNVDVPEVKGYTADKKTVSAFIHSDGTITTTESVKYSPKEVTADLSVKTNLDKDGKPTIIKGVKGKVGEKLEIKAPVFEGYSPDKDVIIALVNADGTITTEDTITYKKGTKGVKKVSRTVSTFSNHSGVTLYSINGTTVTKLTNRALGANSCWASDLEVTINGVTYFRVATNEWVKASDVYQYRSINSVIRTQHTAALVDAQGKLVENRALAGNTDWRTDMIVIINNATYYRVSTNEFLSSTDVY